MTRLDYRQIVHMLISNYRAGDSDETLEYRLREALGEARHVFAGRADPAPNPAHQLLTELSAIWPYGTRISIAHDGFRGPIIGYYVRLDGKRGVVAQYEDANIVHVYGEKWLSFCTD